MRNLLLSLMVLAALVSCGKDKSNGAVNGSTSSAVTIGDTVAQQLGTYINSSESYFAASPVNTATTRYAYATTTTASAAASNCETKTGWLGIKYYVCTSSNTNNNSNITYTYVYANVDLATKRLELINYLNSSTAGSTYQSGSAFYVRTTAGVIYTIDLRYPIQANPVSVQQANGQITYYAGVVY